jgi:hypothetical protein
MSKLILGGFTLSLLISVQVFSQKKPDSNANQLRTINSNMEVFIGPSSVSIHGNEGFANYGVPKVGYAGGIGFIHNFGRKVALNARVLWERKGFRQREVITYVPDPGGAPVTGTLTNNISNDYLTVSILPRFAFGKYGRFNIGAGGYFASLRKSKTTDHYFYPIPYTVTTNSKNEYDQYDGGLSFNLGYTFPFQRSMSFTIQFLNNYGLRQISRFYNLSPGHEPIKNNSYSVLVGVNF